MLRTVPRGVLIGTLVGTLLGVLPAAGAPVGCADPQDGVGVVVDFGDGRVEHGCAEGDPASGEEALRQAGFALQHNRFGLICRVAGHPQECQESPPLDAYWSYWRASAPADGAELEWSYATLGAAVIDPDPGEVEGWRFGGAGRTPPQTPDPSAQPEPTGADPVATSPEDTNTEDIDPAPTGAAQGSTSAAAGPMPTLLVLSALVLLFGSIAWWRRGTRPESDQG